MSNVKFYKTSNPTIVAAANKYWADCNALRKRGLALAEFFGGELLVGNSLSGYKIGGLAFNPPKDERLWTRPDRANAGRQYPRASIKKPTPAEKVELADLQIKYNSHFPTDMVKIDPMLQAMGTNFGNCFFGTQLSVFMHKGDMYAKTGAPLNEHMIEILGSEFEAAEKDKDDVTEI